MIVAIVAVFGGRAWYLHKQSATEKDVVPYEIISYGADGQEGGTGNEEDLVSWKL